MGWYEAAKDAISMAQRADNVELLKQILDMQKAMQEMQQENYDLKKSNEELKALWDVAKRIDYSKGRGAVFVIDDDGSRQGPYCTHCWEVNKKTISMHRRSASYYECPHCKAGVKTSLIFDEGSTGE